MCATPTGEAFALVRIIEREEWNKAQNILVTLDLTNASPLLPLSTKEAWRGLQIPLARQWSKTLDDVCDMLRLHSA